MRETKDQKIERLTNKVKGMETEIKELKSQLRKQLKINTKQSITAHSNEENLKKEYEELKKEKEMLIGCIEDQLKDIKYYKRRLNYLDNDVEEFKRDFREIFREYTYGVNGKGRVASMLQELDTKALEYFGYDDWGVSKYNQLFFDLDTYIINIHPVYGYALSPMEQDYIKKEICDDPYYKKLLSSTKELRKLLKIPNNLTDITKTSEFHQKGKDLMNKLYLHFFFSPKDIVPIQELLGFQKVKI